MKINNQSDFKIKEVTKNEDFNVRFRFEFFVYEFKKYVVSWDGKEYVNCKRLDDGSLEIIFNNPKFGLGQLKVRREYYISDEDFIDGIWNAVTVEKTGIYITDGETDDIDVENVIVPPYIKGEPGKDMKWSTMTQDEKDELINDLGEGINNSFVEAETTRNNNEELRKTSESARVTAEQGRVEAELKRGTDFDTLKSEMQTAIDEGKAATKETIAATEGLDAIVEEQNAKLTELGSEVDKYVNSEDFSENIRYIDRSTYVDGLFRANGEFYSSTYYRTDKYDVRGLVGTIKVSINTNESIANQFVLIGFLDKNGVLMPEPIRGAASVVDEQYLVNIPIEAEELICGIQTGGSSFASVQVYNLSDKSVNKIVEKTNLLYVGIEYKKQIEDTERKINNAIIYNTLSRPVTFTKILGTGWVNGGNVGEKITFRDTTNDYYGFIKISVDGIVRVRAENIQALQGKGDVLIEAVFVGDDDIVVERHDLISVETLVPIPLAEYDVPNGARYCYINVTKNDVTSIVAEYVWYNFNGHSIFSTQNQLYKKSVAFFGDSICAGGIQTEGDPRNGGYCTLIGKSNSMDYVNYGLGGLTFANKSESQNSILKMIRSKDISPFDYVIVQGGINDVWNTGKLGEVSNSYDNFDDSTMCGAVESICQYLIALKKKVGIIISMKIKDSTWESVYAPKIIEICKKYGVPYIDLRYCAGFGLDNPKAREIYAKYNGNVAEYRQDSSYLLDDMVTYEGIVYKAKVEIPYPSGDWNPNKWIPTTDGTDYDGIHPNIIGYKMMSAKIEAWMRTL